MGLPAQAGLQGLAKALSRRFYAHINEDEICIRDHTLTYRALECRVQTARRRKQMELHPCKTVGHIEYTGFAKAIDSRITCEAVSCYSRTTHAASRGANKGWELEKSGFDWGGQIRFSYPPAAEEAYGFLSVNGAIRNRRRFCRFPAGGRRNEHNSL